jgi:hypothetical protein
MSNVSDVPHRLCRRSACGNDQRRSSYHRTDLTNHLHLHFNNAGPFERPD